MKRRRVALLLTSVALVILLAFAWLAAPIWRETYYLARIEGEGSAEVPPEEMQRTFEKLSSVCRCKNLDRLLAGVDRFLLEQQPEESISERVHEAETRVALRCKSALIRLLDRGLDDETRFRVLYIGRRMKEQAAFLVPRLREIAYDTSESTRIRMQGAATVGLIASLDVWSTIVVELPRTRDDEELLAGLLIWVETIGANEELIEKMRSLLDVDALRVPAAYAVLGTSPDIESARVLLRRLDGDNATHRTDARLALLKAPVLPVLAELEKMEDDPEARATLRELIKLSDGDR